MICFPNAKINLGLNVVSRRDDGFHDIDTVMVPVGFCDILEIIPAQRDTAEFSLSGLEVPGSSEDNLCMKALGMFRAFRPGPQVSMHLHKVIPAGSGLGGGSSDAAFTLKALNQVLHEELSEVELTGMSSGLGSDCAFFIRNRAARATGRGEVLQEIHVDLSGKEILLVIPRIHVSTAWAYSRIKPGRHDNSPAEIVLMGMGQWKENLVNDFEAPVFEAHPVLQEIRDRLYSLGAEYAAMSGSGSAIYGIFMDMPLNLEEEFKGVQVIRTAAL